MAGLATTSCGTAEEFVLLNDLSTYENYKMPYRKDLKIKRGDDLRIIVSHKVEQISDQFIQRSNLTDGKDYSNYTVSQSGYINFPLLDTIKVVGMTCPELEQKMKQIIEEHGLATNPSVNVKLTNFKVTVIGESGTGVYEFDDANVSILDLLAKANLLNNYYNGQYGSSIRRDKILVMREENGVLHSDYISLLTKDVLYSPYFYLQQNDVVYVFPSKTTIRQSNRLFDFWWGRLSVLTTTLSVVTLFLTLMNNRKAQN